MSSVSAVSPDCFTCSASYNPIGGKYYHNSQSLQDSVVCKNNNKVFCCLRDSFLGGEYPSSCLSEFVGGLSGNVCSQGSLSDLGPIWYQECARKPQRKCQAKQMIRPTRVVQKTTLKITNDDEMNYCQFDIQIDQDKIKVAENSKIQISLSDLQGFIIYIYIVSNNNNNNKLDASMLLNDGNQLEKG